MSSPMSKPANSIQNQAFFFDNIRSDVNEVRLSAINMIRKISQELGPDETLHKIFPMVQELTKDVDEDIRFALLEQLVDFLDLIGGEPHLTMLLDTFEIFLSSDDVTIRNKAVEVILDTIEKLPPKAISSSFVPFVLRMLDNGWFTARLSGVILWPTAYKCSDPDSRDILLKKLISLSDDQIMTVRRLFASNLPIVLKAVSPRHFIEHLFSLSIELLNNNNDTIKMSAIDSLVSILSEISEFKDKCQEIMTSLRQLVQDKSWRIRYSLVTKYPELKSLSQDKDMIQKLLSDIDSLLDDKEAEVRSAAASVLSNMFKEGDTEYINMFFTQSTWDRIENLVSNCDSDIGSTIVDQIGTISKYFDQKQYTEYFIPFLDRVLKSPNPEIKLKGLSILSILPSDLNILQEDLINGLKDMSNNQIWRIRLSLVEHISDIASSMAFDNNESEWTDWCINMLQDDANAVREGTVSTVVELMKKLGDEWVMKFIDERLKFYNECDNYLLRITTIYLFKKLCKKSESREVQDILIQHLLSFNSDRIANVRLNIAKALGEVHDIVNRSSFANEAVSLLRKLSLDDPDPDVNYFAQKSLCNYKEQED